MVLEVYNRHSKVIEHHLRHLDPVLDGVVDWLSKKHWVFFGIDFELFKYVPVNFLHMIPVLNYSMLNWVTQFDQSLMFLLKNHPNLVLTA